MLHTACDVVFEMLSDYDQLKYYMASLILIVVKCCNGS